MMDRLTMVSVNYNIKVNTKKTKVMRVSKGSESSMKIVVAGEIIEQVKEFFYLGSMISDDARCHREIKRRIAMGKEVFSRRKELLRRGLKRCLRKRTVKTLIWNVTLHCAGTWTLRKEDITRLEALKCGYGVGWRRSVGQSTCQMRRC